MSERDDETRDPATVASNPGGEANTPVEGALPASSPEGATSASGVSHAAPSGRVHRVRGGLLLLLGAAGTFLIMCREQSQPHGVLWGMLTTLVATLGLLDAAGLLTAGARADGSVAGATDWRETGLHRREGEPFALSPAVTVPLSLGLFALVLAAFGVAAPHLGRGGALPLAILAALVPLALSAIRRPALLVFVVGAGIVLPFLGVYGLWDPWETHYGEVAREILSRDDWISLWWAQEDWFWSKPIFIFWIEALSMGLLGVDFHPDANPVHPEWALRLPHFLLTMGALLSVYALVQRAFGKRAGVLAAVVLATMPHFFLLSHQAITDMPFVSTMTMAMAMLGLALTEASEREVTTYRFGPLLLSAQHAVLAALSFACIPQIVMLMTRNVTLVTGGFAWHRDRFVFGSAGNGGNPGNAAIREVTPAFDGLAAQPFVQGLCWLLGFSVLVWMLRRERRARGLYLFAFYFFCALSFMAKGIPGFALPGLVAMFWLAASRRWDLLLSGELRVGRGMLTVVTVGMPWYVAMYVRHGQGFTDRLLVHDHINRLTAGVHGDTGSIEYFFEQLGFGLFPWIGLAPFAVAAWAMLHREAPVEADGADAGRGLVRRDVLMLVGLWGTAAFVLFSAMTTKFHHYIFPAVPASGILVGIALDGLFGRRSDLRAVTARGVLGTVVAVFAPVPVVLGVAGWWGDVRGVVPAQVPAAQMRDWVLRHPWYGMHVAGLVVLGLVAAAAAAWWLRAPDADAEGARGGGTWGPAAATGGLFAAPVLVALVGRDLSWVTSARPHGFERLIHLFVYNYQRQWPEHLDYRPILTGFSIVAAAVIGIAALPWARQVALRAFVGLAIAFAVWSLDVYLVDLSPHWGQRELFARYYAARSGPEEPVIAWQMNWKGENFYTGNRVFAFVDLDNRRLQDWARDHAGQRAFFVLEHQRLANLRSVLRGAEVEPLTTERDDNKFLLVSARLPAPETPRPPPVR